MHKKKVKIMFNRKLSGKKTEGSKLGSHYTARGRKTSSIEDKASIAEISAKNNNPSTGRHCIETKNKLNYSPMSINGKLAYGNMGSSTPINFKKAPPVSLKSGKFINTDRPKTGMIHSRVKACKSRRAEPRSVNLFEKDPIKDCAEEKETGENKSGLNSYISESHRLSKTGGIYGKYSTGKHLDNKVSSKLSHEVMHVKGQFVHGSPKERNVASFMPTNAKSVEKMESIKNTSKIRPILVSLQSSTKATEKKAVKGALKAKRKGTATDFRKRKSTDSSGKTYQATAKRKPHQKGSNLKGKPDEKPKPLMSFKTSLEKKPHIIVEGRHVEIDFCELERRPEPPRSKSCMKKATNTEKPKATKTVTFADRLIVNEDSLDSDMMERIHHNLEYNDDRIFENLSIFQQLSRDNSEIKPATEDTKKVEDRKENEASNDQPAIGDSGNKDFTDIEQNQGILSSCEESGAINDSKKEKKPKEPFFEAQVSVIERMEETKEAYEIIKEFSNLDFSKSGNQENSSGFMKLNDSLIKSREVLKDKSIKRESIKQLSSNKKIKDSFLFKNMEQQDESSVNYKQSPSLVGTKEFLEGKPQSSKNLENKIDNIKKDSTQMEFEADLPNDNFFEEKGSESIIEKNDEESKFVDEESYSMVYLTKQQNSNNPQSSLKLNFANSLDNNTKELSKIEDIEGSEDNKDDEKIKLEYSSQKQEEENSISQMNSPMFKAESTISYNQDPSKIEVDPEKSDTIGLILEEEAKSKPERQDIAIEKQDSTSEKPSATKDIHKKVSEFNSLSEIFGDRVDFDMSTIKEMMESLEEDSFQFANSKTEINKPKAGLKLTPRDERSQNSFEKIIKYMKKEISKIDTVKRREKNPEKVANIIKNFIQNVKRIEISPRIEEKSGNIQFKASQQLTSNMETPEPKEDIPKSQTTVSVNTAATKKVGKQELYVEEGMNSNNESPSDNGSYVFEEENIMKDMAEPIPNKLPPMATHYTKSQEDQHENDDCFNNKGVNRGFQEFMSNKNKRILSQIASKDEFRTPYNMTITEGKFPKMAKGKEDNKLKKNKSTQNKSHMSENSSHETFKKYWSKFFGQ
ncbi:unnamed protein product [Moneuplotes crassus]|uniref:Uncharacterized protein n=2 Tax=Euplotes crassus TaxID=5936 RepID=A0AAD1XNI9_EUPCR|nr:unnamed protein product [Moneuplotes crassus]